MNQCQHVSTCDMMHPFTYKLGLWAVDVWLYVNVYPSWYVRFVPEM